MDAEAKISVDFWRVLDSKRPVAEFRPGDVTVVRLDGSEPVTIWDPAAKRASKMQRRQNVGEDDPADDDRDASSSEGSEEDDEDADAAAWSDAASDAPDQAPIQ